MRRSETRRRTLALGAFLAPVIVVKGLGLLSGGPAESSASPVAVTPVAASANVPAVFVASPWPAEAVAAASHAQQLVARPLAGSPFYYAPRRDPVVTPAASDVRPEDVPRFELRAILASRDHTIANINGRLCRAGDRIGATGWIVESIDSSARTAVLREESTGRTHTIQVRMPDGD